jgi:hypothetical protein
MTATKKVYLVCYIWYDDYSILAIKESYEKGLAFVEEYIAYQNKKSEETNISMRKEHPNLYHFHDPYRFHNHETKYEDSLTCLEEVQSWQWKGRYGSIYLFEYRLNDQINIDFLKFRDKLHKEKQKQLKKEKDANEVRL